MKNEMSRPIFPTPSVLNEAALASLPRLEDLPEANRQELIQTLAILLLRLPALQALLEERHEPE
jgi:hypothetical protein